MSAATLRCDDLDAFFDGELAAGDAAAFRDHLAGCERCQGALRGRMLEAAVVAGPRRACAPAPDVVPLPARRTGPRRRAWLPAVVAATSALAAAAIFVMWLRPAGGPAPEAPREEAAWLRLAPRRGVDVRFSAPALDAYRPRNVVRAAGSGSAAREDLSLQDLAALERARDLHALVGAHALKGEVLSAIDKAAQLPRDAASLSDRAALALLESDAGKGPSNAERALSLAAEALRLDSRLPQAAWNQAVALERLELPRAAAAAFEAIAVRGEPGWSAEAAARAADLRRRYDEDLRQRKQLEDAATAMIHGGAPMTAAAAERAGSFARSALHVAIAAAADPARLAALAPLAEAFGVGPELAKIRRSDLARRAPIAAELAAAAAAAKPDPAALRAIRARARAAGQDDIARAVTLLIADDDTIADDLGELAALGAAGPWWRLAAAEREVFYLTYWAQRYAEAELAARDVLAGCRAGARELDAFWCPQLLRTLAAGNAEIGRIDRAYELAAEARRIARGIHDRGEEGRALNVTGQIAAARVVGWDPSPVADAYLRESAHRLGVCSARLYQLDFGARAALDHHRFAEAEGLLAEADRLDETEADCKKEGVRYNAEEARLRLIVHRPTVQRVDELARRVRRIEEQFGQKLFPDNRLYHEYLLARARFAIADRAPELAALRDVIARAGAASGELTRRTIRAMGGAALVEAAARRGDAEAALAGLAERMGVRIDPVVAATTSRSNPGCLVGISHDDRVTVIVRGAGGRAVAEVREVPEGQRVLSAAELLSRPMRERLAGCPGIEVLATGPYFGVAGLLGPEQRWTYRSSPHRATGPLRFDRQVVVTDVEPPADLGLPPLRPMQLGSAARLVTGRLATPGGVIEAIADAQLVVINAHGVTDANEPSAASLVLSPDAKGSYWLTAERVKQARLSGAPVVILAACHAGRVQVSTEPWSLASSFLAAGARAVIAPTTEIADDTANGVFESIVSRMQAGRTPEQAVAEEREASGARAPWLANVVVFQ